MRSIDKLIERSSLGTPQARAARRRAPRAVVERVLERTKSNDARQISPRLSHSPSWLDGHQADNMPNQGDTHMLAARSLEPGQFTIRPVRMIGEGGLGVVDEVVVTASNRTHPVGTRLARKRLGTAWSNDAGAQARFEREIAMLAAMRHPNVVSVEGASLPGGERWYAMPLFSRGSLRSWQQAGGRFRTAQEVAGFVATIADALAYAHSLGFIHRDLKPENVLISDEGAPIVADWGLGQFVHVHSKVLDLTRGGPMGTHYYCSLEQWTTGRSTAAGDVYSLGVVMAELAAGRAVPISPVGAGIQQDLVGGQSWVARTFNATLRKMTAAFAGSRFQSIAEVATVLRTIASG